MNNGKLVCPEAAERRLFSAWDIPKVNCESMVLPPGEMRLVIMRNTLIFA